MRLAAQWLRGLKPAKGKRLKILDLCCYVGQWSAQLTRVYRDAGLEVDVTAVDASEKALTFAKRNIEAQGASCTTLKAGAKTCSRGGRSLQDAEASIS